MNSPRRRSRLCIPSPGAILKDADPDGAVSGGRAKFSRRQKFSNSCWSARTALICPVRPCALEVLPRQNHEHIGVCGGTVTDFGRDVCSQP